MIFLPRTFKQSDFAFQRTGHIFVYTHIRIRIFGVQIQNGSVQISKNTIRYQRTFVTRTFHLFLYGIKYFIYPSEFTIVNKHLIIIPGTEIISLSFTIIQSTSGLSTISPVIDQEVKITNIIIIPQCYRTAQRSFSREAGIDGI